MSLFFNLIILLPYSEYIIKLVLFIFNNILYIKKDLTQYTINALYSYQYNLFKIYYEYLPTTKRIYVSNTLITFISINGFKIPLEIIEIILENITYEADIRIIYIAIAIENNPNFALYLLEHSSFSPYIKKVNNDIVKVDTFILTTINEYNNDIILNFLLNIPNTLIDSKINTYWLMKIFIQGSQNQLIIFLKKQPFINIKFFKKMLNDIEIDNIIKIITYMIIYKIKLINQINGILIKSSINSLTNLVNNKDNNIIKSKINDNLLGGIKSFNEAKMLTLLLYSDHTLFNSTNIGEEIILLIANNDIFHNDYEDGCKYIYNKRKEIFKNNVLSFIKIIKKYI